MFACLECGKKFRTVKAAERAASNGCPKCRGVDVDLAPVSVTSERDKYAIRPSGEVNAMNWLAEHGLLV